MIASAIISLSHGTIQPGMSLLNALKTARETCHVDINANIDAFSVKTVTRIVKKK